jgi:electron transfer flavoprotein alpha subunit
MKRPSSSGKENMSAGTYIIAERIRGRIMDETFELITFARELIPGTLPVVIILGGTAGEALALAEKSGCDVIAVMGESLADYNAHAYHKAILAILSPLQPAWICLLHTSTGYDLAPGLAVGLKAACITAVEAVHGGTFTRSVFSGKFTADIIPASASTVLTIQPGAYSRSTESNGPAGRVTLVDFSLATPRMKALGIREPVYRDSALKDAEVIISAGRGIGRKENLSLLKGLASLFPGSALGASRPVCDLGWMEYKHQIGTTGQTVSPKLYLACGISGAIQHISGMKTSQTIVAINLDPQAAIFRIAHFCIVEDVVTFIPVLIEETHRAPRRDHGAVSP